MQNTISAAILAALVILAVAFSVGGPTRIITDDGEPVGQQKVGMIMDDPCPF